MTQVMGLVRLAPEIQQHILSFPDMLRRSAITERALRPIALLDKHSAQQMVYSMLLDHECLADSLSNLADDAHTISSTPSRPY